MAHALQLLVQLLQCQRLIAGMHCKNLTVPLMLQVLRWRLKLPHAEVDHLAEMLPPPTVEDSDKEVGTSTSVHESALSILALQNLSISWLPRFGAHVAEDF